jgi:predicted nucleotide-binding protein
MEAFSRTTGKPGVTANKPEIVWRREFEAVHPDEPVDVDLKPTWPGAPLPMRIKIVWYDVYGERFQTSVEVPLRNRGPRPDLRSPVPLGFATAAGGLAARSSKPTESVGTRQYAESVPDVNPRDVFVVVGRNNEANKAMFTFLRAINLKPMEWSAAIAATGSGSPFIGNALDAAFAKVQAVVVFMTPDDIAQLRPEYASGPSDPEVTPTPQPRPNVLFEAGMALGHHPNRTILVELGSLRSFSDIAGRHTVRIDNSAEKRSELANRLKNAGCAVDTSGPDWFSAGDFRDPKVHSGPTPTGRRLPSGGPAKARNRLDARYLPRTSGSDRITVQNVGPEEVFDLNSPNVKDFHGRIDGFPIRRLPVGKSATLHATAAMGVPDTWDLIVTGRTESGEEFTEPLFLDLNG